MAGWLAGSGQWAVGGCWLGSGDQTGSQSVSPFSQLVFGIRSLSFTHPLTLTPTPTHIHSQQSTVVALMLSLSVTHSSLSTFALDNVDISFTALCLFIVAFYTSLILVFCLLYTSMSTLQTSTVRLPTSDFCSTV